MTLVNIDILLNDYAECLEEHRANYFINWQSFSVANEFENSSIKNYLFQSVNFIK